MEKEPTNLQPTKKNTLSLEPIYKTSDLINRKPICMQLKEFDKDTILTEIKLSVVKCATGLGINMSPMQVEILCEDLMDSYTNDSIEDIQECLKAGRRGVYGYGHENRNKLNLLIIKEWMSKHLEKKYEAKEALLNKNKIENNEPLKGVDYAAYKAKQVAKAKPSPNVKIKVPERKQTLDLNQIYQNIQAKLYQDQELTEEEDDFLRRYKIEIKDRVLHQRL